MPQTPDNVPPIADYSRLLDGRVAAITGGGRNGSSIGARAARAGRPAIGLLPLAQRLSESRLVCRLWVCICSPSGSTNTINLAQ